MLLLHFEASFRHESRLVCYKFASLSRTLRKQENCDDDPHKNKTPETKYDSLFYSHFCRKMIIPKDVTIFNHITNSI